MRRLWFLPHHFHPTLTHHPVCLPIVRRLQLERRLPSHSGKPRSLWDAGAAGSENFFFLLLKKSSIFFNERKEERKQEKGKNVEMEEEKRDSIYEPLFVTKQKRKEPGWARLPGFTWELSEGVTNSTTWIIRHHCINTLTVLSQCVLLNSSLYLLDHMK